MRAGSRSKSVALIGMFAAAYALVVYMLPGISFMSLNIRVADALRGLIPFFGLPCVFGIALGHFVANLQSPLGVIDLATVPIVLLASLAAYIISKRSLALCFIPIWLSLALWVSYMLSAFMGVDYMLMFMTLAPQIFISDYVLPVMLAYAFKRVYPVFKSRVRGCGCR